jgi:hypothetical protein
MNEQLPPHTRIILEEMCKRVGTTLNEVNTQEEDWYLKHRWTSKEEEDFREWLVNYLYKSSSARNEIMNFPKKSKPYIRLTATWFMFSYGWRLK